MSDHVYLCSKHTPDAPISNPCTICYLRGQVVELQYALNPQIVMQEKLSALQQENAKLSARIKVLEKDREVLANERDGWKRAYNMYRSAWLREIGGVINVKAHEIDGFVLRTRDIYENSRKYEQENAELRVRCDRWATLAQEAGCTECSPTYTEISAQVAALRDALNEAAITISFYKGTGRDWELYKVSPEWTQIDAALNDTAAAAKRHDAEVLSGFADRLEAMDDFVGDKEIVKYVAKKLRANAAESEAQK